jgi:predicted PurR-regulated permease PerM
MLGLTIGLLALVAASARVIGWVLAAAILAGLLHPVRAALARRIHRGLALAVVVIVSLGVAAALVWAVVDDVAEQVDELQRALPRAARQLERSETFGETAQELRLSERASSFVAQLPERLRGGEVQDAIRSAATRSIAFLATAVLTVFFLLHGPRLLAAGVRQLPAHRQEEVDRVGRAVYRRSWHYVAGTLAMSVMAGLIAYGCAWVLEVPGPAPLALFVAMLDVLPLIGIVLGAVPLILLAATNATWQGTVAIGVILVTWQVIEGVYLQRRVEEHSLHLGVFLTFAVAMVGLELYGIGGALVGLVLTVVAAATADEVLGHGPHASSTRVGSGG